MIDGVQSIAVVRALGGIGDVLCVVPALKRLRALAPDARITYIGRPQIEGVVARYPALVDRFLAFSGFPGVPEHPFDPAALTAWLEARAREERFDLAIQLHGSGSVTNVFTGLIGAKRQVGYHVPGLWAPDAASPPFPDALAEVARWTALIDTLGVSGTDDALEFPVADTDRDAVRSMLPPGRYTVVHAGASDPRRRWPVDRFAAVADALAGQGLTIVLTGTADEADAVAGVANAMSASSISLCGRTTLGQAAALIEGATIVVTNDTGTSHIAAALAVPSVVIFIASDPARWAPANAALHVAVGGGVNDLPIGSTSPRREAVYPSVEAVRDAALRLTDDLDARAAA